MRRKVAWKPRMKPWALIPNDGETTEELGEHETETGIMKVLATRLPQLLNNKVYVGIDWS